VPDPIVPRLPVLAEFDTSILRRAAAARRLDALFKATSSDFLLREQFVTDPAQILSEYVHGASAAPSAASVTNHLLYSVMANRRLRTWLSEYATRHKGTWSRQDFLTDLGRAVAREGDEHVVYALIRSTIEKDGTAGFEAFESIVSALGSVFRPRGDTSGPTGGPPTGGPPTGGPPTGGPPTGGPPTGGPPTGGPPTGGPPTGGPPTGGPPTGGPPTGGPPTGGPPTGGPPTDGSVFGHLPDYVQLAMDDLIRFAVNLRDIGALNLIATTR
jgi:hypothetical protein